MRINEKYEEYFKNYKEENPDWDTYLTDSTYYELKEFYAHKTKQPFDDDNGYPDDVDDFASYVWNMYISPYANIIEPVEKKTLDGGIIQVIIKTNYKLCIYSLEKQDNERSVTIVLENNDFLQTTFVIPMGEGFNFFDYEYSTKQEGNKIVIVFMPRKALIGAKQEKIIAKEIGEPILKYL